MSPEACLSTDATCSASKTSPLREAAAEAATARGQILQVVGPLHVKPRPRPLRHPAGCLSFMLLGRRVGLEHGNKRHHEPDH